MSASSAGVLTCGRSPACRPARSTSAGSPVVSAAAVSSSVCVWSGSARTWPMNCSSICRPTGSWCGSGARPPRLCTVVSPAPISSVAKGFPPVATMICRATSGCTGPAATLANSCAASGSARPASRSSLTPPYDRCSPSGSRTAMTSPTPSANRRRATKASTSVDSRSSHCASSTTHNRGCRDATVDSNVKVPRLTNSRSTLAASSSPKATRSASRSTGRERLELVLERVHELMQTGVAELHLGFDPDQAQHTQIGRRGDRGVEQRGLADPGLTTYHQRSAEPAADRVQEEIDVRLFSGTPEELSVCHPVHTPTIRQRPAPGAGAPRLVTPSPARRPFGRLTARRAFEPREQSFG